MEFEKEFKSGADMLYNMIKKCTKESWVNPKYRKNNSDVQLVIHLPLENPIRVPTLLKLEGSSINVVYIKTPEFFVIAGQKCAIDRRKNVLSINGISFFTVPADFSDWDEVTTTGRIVNGGNLCERLIDFFGVVGSTLFGRLSPQYRFVAETNLPTSSGTYRVRSYRNSRNEEAVAIISGVVERKFSVLTRIHDQCATSEVFGSLKCDCKDQLDHALDAIRESGCGVIIYLQQEGRGIGLANKIAAYGVQELGFDTVDANRILGLPDDCRKYNSASDILKDLDVRSVRLLTNNPRKIACLSSLGIKVDMRVPCIVHPNSHHSNQYVNTKASRMGHMIGKEKTS